MTNKDRTWCVNVVCGTRTAILGIDTLNKKHLQGLSGFTIRKGRLVNGEYEWEWISNRTLYEKEVRSSMEGLEHIELTYFKDEIYAERKPKLVKRLGEILKTDCSKLRVAELRKQLIEHKIQSLRDDEEEDDISTKMKEVRLDDSVLRRGTWRSSAKRGNISFLTSLTQRSHSCHLHNP